MNKDLKEEYTLSEEEDEKEEKRRKKLEKERKKELLRLKEEKRNKFLIELEKKYDYSKDEEGSENIYTRYGDYMCFDEVKEELMDKEDEEFEESIIENLQLYKKESPYSRYKIIYTNKHDGKITIKSKEEINKNKLLTQDEINDKLIELLTLNDDGYILRSEIFSFATNYGIIKYEKGYNVDKIDQEFMIDMIKNLDSDFLKENREGLFDFLYYYTKEK